MAAYLELWVLGGSKAYVEAGSITGLITAPGHHLFDVANREKPLTVIIRGGETFKVVGESAGKILVRAADARQRFRDQANDLPLIDYLEPEALVEENPAAAF